MVAYFKAIWACRYFWLSLVKMDLRSRYRGSVLGMGWSLLYPICMTTIICVAFGGIFGITDMSRFAPFLMAGLTFWNYLNSVSVGGCQSFFNGESYIRQHPAPMAIYPLRTMLGGAFHYSLGLTLVIFLGGIMHGYDNPWPLFTLIPTVLLLLVFGWAVAIIFAVVNVRFRDTNHLSELGLQILFYVTPVMYSADILVKRGVGFVLWFNPVVPFLELLRKPLVDCELPSPMAYLMATLITAAVSVIAAAALRSQERELIFHM
jgi:lipopolysaccharide transport system permease protein